MSNTRSKIQQTRIGVVELKFSVPCWVSPFVLAVRCSGVHCMLFTLHESNFMRKNEMNFNTFIYGRLVERSPISATAFGYKIAFFSLAQLIISHMTPRKNGRRIHIKLTHKIRNRWMAGILVWIAVVHVTPMETEMNFGHQIGLKYEWTVVISCIHQNEHVDSLLN